MTQAGAFTVEPGHPALEGHFPGRPILPGVVLLDHVITCILAAEPARRAAGLPTVKFLRPVRPGDRVDILRGPERDGRVAFACRVGELDVARGAVLLANAR